MTKQIEEKWRQLQDVGLDLGNPVGPEQDTGSDGTFQQYKNGRIYWHEHLGTFAVQGSMLDRYIELGKPDLGFPTSDETQTDDGLYPAQYFERGAIIQVRGTNGVCIQGDFYQAWRQAGGELGEWGYPVADQVEIAGGTAVYFERGCMWKRHASTDDGQSTQIMRCRLYPPLLGRPRLINPDEPIRLESILIWELPTQGGSLPADSPPDFFVQLWNGLVLNPVTAPGTPAQDVPLRAERSARSEQGFVHLDLVADAGLVSDRTLYTIALRLSEDTTYELAPHAIYMKSAWDNFAIIHATDLHISRRVEDFERRLRELGLEEAAEKCNSFNDNFRDLIRYANHLHDNGLADVILMTGDVTDYVFEQDDNKAGGGNFYFFEQLVRGLWPAHGDRESEELRVPIFTILGNHDYRPNGYALLSDLDIGDEGKWDWWPDWLYAPAKCDNINGYAAHNLTMEEALALQGGHKDRLDTPAAYEVVRVDPGSLKYYHERINDLLSYRIELGKHRVVMIDSRWEVGIVEGTFRDFLKFALNKLDKDARDWLAQHPNCVGFEDDELQMVRDALSEGDPDAIVIVGVHAPPINPSGDEWPHYFRETEHPTADEAETVGYLMRRDRKTFFPKERHKQPVDSSQVYPDWVRTGTPYFKQGGIEDLLDYGIAKGSTEAFLEMCVGQGVARKVDLVLCGHIHSNVEYRLDWDPEKRFLFHTDFYTENPGVYYPTLSARDPMTGEYNLDGRPATRIDISIKEDTPLRAVPIPVSDGHATLDIPAYKNPLNSDSNPREWWDRRRPLVMQTASLGSMDRGQRVEMPVPSFQGFRVITVEADTISKIRYVTLRDLRKNDFLMPWEAERKT